MPPIRLQLVCDHQMLAEALAWRLSHEPGAFVIDHRRSVDRNLLEALRTHRPDVVLVDASSVVGHWSVLVDRLVEASPRIRVAVLSDTSAEEDATLAARRCLSAWLQPGITAEQLVEVLRGVADGQTVYPAIVLGGVLRRLAAELRGSSGSGGSLPPLTDRERDVLACLLKGLPGSEIAEHLGMATNTVRSHTSRIFRKLGVHSRLEAVRMARESDLELRLGARSRPQSPPSGPPATHHGAAEESSEDRPDRPSEYGG